MPDKNLIYVPLERLDSRYTTHLDNDILSFLRSNRIKYRRIDAPYSAEPSNGDFLNPSYTMLNKSTQLIDIAKLYSLGYVTNYTTFFFSDLWFPGLEQIAYLNYHYNVEPKITGIVHAGSFTDYDEARNMEWWAGKMEEMIFGIADTIYVGSNFLKGDLLQKRMIDYKKIVVTHLPIDRQVVEMAADLTNNRKENIVVFTGRDHPDKQPDEWRRLCDWFDGSDIKFVWTQKENLPKMAYYELLSKAKCVVSFALQENFGFGIIEATMLGCVPVLPDRLVYKEFFVQEYRYKNFEDLVRMIEQSISGHLQSPKLKINNNPLKIWFNEFI